jgi:hypothetical protein
LRKLCRLQGHPEKGTGIKEYVHSFSPVK